MTENKSKSKVTASEIVGDLRKMRRMYEVFAHASEIADVLAKQEAKERGLQKSITSLEEKEASLDKVLENKEAIIEAKKEQIESMDEVVKEAKAVYTNTLEAAKADASTKATEIIASAEDKAKRIQIDIDNLITNRNSLLSDTQEAKQELINVKEQIDAMKQKVLDSLS